jgi:hypothetical protein
MPGQIIFAPAKNKSVIPSTHDASYVAKSPSEIFMSENDSPRSPGAGYPRLASPEGDSSSSDASSSHANPHDPTGKIGARTPGGQPANDPNQLAKSLKAQLNQPIRVEKSDASDSPGVQPIPDSFARAGLPVRKRTVTSAVSLEKESEQNGGK